MASTLPPPLLRLRYFHAAQDYCAQLPPEHFMEATPQGTQREVSLESLALVKAQRSDVHVFNELLVQYPFGRDEKIHHVVPDNMIVLYDGVIEAEGSYDVPFQPVRPFMTMEYVSKSSKRKDYEDSFHKYERAEGALLSDVSPRQPGTDSVPAQRSEICHRQTKRAWAFSDSRAGPGDKD